MPAADNRSLRATPAVLRQQARVGVCAAGAAALLAVFSVVGLAAMLEREKGAALEAWNNRGGSGGNVTAPPFCATVPCVRTGDAGSLSLTQPSSFALVIFLAVEYIAAGAHVMVRAVRDGAWVDRACGCSSSTPAASGPVGGKARAWWSYAFVAWGLSW